MPERPSRLAEIQPFHVMALLARARALEAAGRSIVHMEIGEPDFPTPRPMVEAAMRAIETGNMHYTPARGLAELREAIAGWYARSGVRVDPERILVTPGASGALLLVFGALVGPESGVLMADPGYPCNRNLARFIEGRAQGVPVGPDTAWQLTPDLVEGHWREDTAAVLLASPANPTGTLVPAADLQAIAGLARRRGGRLIVDEIYHGLVYGGRAHSALEFTDEAFVVNSFSKYFGMTGWRLGWVVAPSDYIGDLDKLAQNLFLAAPTPAQHAALAAFEPQTLEILEARREAFRERRDFLFPALRGLGFDIPLLPEGAFYLYANCERFTRDSFGFARDLLEQAGVAITPGCDFGSHRAEAHARFAYTTSLDRLEEGVRRLADYLG